MVITPVPEPDPAVERPFGAWATPVTSEVVVAAAVRLGEVRVDGTDVVWAEGRPGEGGRTQLVRRRADGGTDELLPEGRNARTAVHEYGGAAWWVRDGVVWFTDWADQRLYRLEPGAGARRAHPRAGRPRGDRYADGDLGPDGTRIVCVRERHHGDRGHRRRQRDRRSSTRARPASRRCWSPAPTSSRPRGCPRTAPRWPGCSGTTRRCRGTPPSWWSATSRPARRPSSPAGRASRCRAASGGPTARCGSSPTAPTGGTSTAGCPAHDIEAVVRHRGRHRRARVGVRHVPLRGARRRAGGRGALARRVRRPGGARARRRAHRPRPALHRRRLGRRRGPDAVVVVAGSPTAEPGVHRVDLSGAGHRRTSTTAARAAGPGARPPTRSRDRRRCGSRPSTARASRARPARCSTRRSTPGTGARQGSGRRCSS